MGPCLPATRNPLRKNNLFPVHGLVPPIPPPVVPGGARSADPGPTIPCARAYGCRIAASGGVRHDGKEGATRPRSMRSFRRFRHPSSRTASAMTERKRPPTAPFQGLVPPNLAKPGVPPLCMGSFRRFPPLVVPGGARSADPGPIAPRARDHGCRIAAPRDSTGGGVRHDGKNGATRPPSMGSFRRIGQDRPPDPGYMVL